MGIFRCDAFRSDAYFQPCRQVDGKRFVKRTVRHDVCNRRACTDRFGKTLYIQFARSYFGIRFTPGSRRLVCGKRSSRNGDYGAQRRFDDRLSSERSRFYVERYKRSNREFYPLGGCRARHRCSSRNRRFDEQSHRIFGCEEFIEASRKIRYGNRRRYYCKRNFEQCEHRRSHDSAAYARYSGRRRYGDPARRIYAARSCSGSASFPNERTDRLYDLCGYDFIVRFYGCYYVYVPARFRKNIKNPVVYFIAGYYRFVLYRIVRAQLSGI